MKYLSGIMTALVVLPITPAISVIVLWLGSN